MSDADHRFGGEWTEIKLAVLDAYSTFFNTVLKNKGFERWYIDGFAGTGERVQKRQLGGLFDNAPLEVCEETLDGSARKALAASPPFDHLVWIEKRTKHFRALEALAALEPERDIRTINGDANTELPKLLAAPPWTGPDAYKQRAVVFLDPYGINVNFDTLRAPAACKKADVWLLVNLKAAVQQLSRNHDALDAGKRDALSRFFGTDRWEAEFYNFQENSGDLFAVSSSRSGTRTVDRYDVAKFYRSQLELLFGYVSDPFPLKVGNQEDYFQLYCMSNNPSAAAITLIKRGCVAVQKKFGPASRQRSAL